MPGVDLNYFMRQATKLTEKVEQRKKELAVETQEGQAGDGRVVVVVNGLQEVRSIKLAKEVVDPGDVGLLEDLVTAAVNAALAASRSHMQTELAKVSGGVNLAGLMP
jgi:DNA-binding YbaB/EbfC family protein